MDNVCHECYIPVISIQTSESVISSGIKAGDATHCREIPTYLQHIVMSRYIHRVVNPITERYIPVTCRYVALYSQGRKLSTL